jgi:hypothetical protein
MWHYDIETGRSPVLVGYVNLGLAPAATIALTQNFFLHGAFGLNRMGYRFGDSTDYTTGALTELSAGYLIGTGGKGVTVEAVFQNRTGITGIRYGVLRVAAQF